jgi:hypothetical protein
MWLPILPAALAQWYARWRNAAIWARVSSPFGQKRFGAHPGVMPAAARRLIASSLAVPSSSVK